MLNSGGTWLTKALRKTFNALVPSGRRQRGYHAIRRIFRSAGLAVREYSPKYDTGARRAAMMAHYGISTVVDVGANAGQYGTELRINGFKGKILSFEPVRSVFEELLANTEHDKRWKAFHLAVGAEEGEITINVAVDTGCSSILPLAPRFSEDTADARYVGQEKVRISTLDRLLPAELEATERVLLKIDVQGYEHQVIRGAAGILDKVLLIECELSTVVLYEHQLLLPDMIALLQENNFVLVSVDPFYFNENGECWQLDGIFARQFNSPRCTVSQASEVAEC